MKYVYTFKDNEKNISAAGSVYFYSDVPEHKR